MQMLAGGGVNEPIHFTNILFDGELYTLTYKWFDTLPPDNDECVCLGRLTLETLNACLDTSRLVGPEVLINGVVRRRINHYRVGVLLGNSENTAPAFRAPIMEGDFYVDPKNPSKFWKLLHFGWQNLLDPALDEWITLKDFKYTAGQVSLPTECKPSSCPDQDVFGAGYFCK